MDLATSPTRTRFPLSPKKVLKKTLSSTIGYLILLPILYGVIIWVLSVLSQATSGPGSFNPSGLYFPLTLGMIVFFFIILIPTYLYQQWYFKVYYYELGESFITIRKGVIMPREITVPYERIQDVYVDQDFLDRLFGLYDVHLSSATITSGFEAHIDGVEKEASVGLRDTLLETIHQKITRKPDQPTPVFAPSA